MQLRNDWYNLPDPYVINEDLHFRYSYNVSDHKNFSFNELGTNKELSNSVKEEIRQFIEKKYQNYPKGHSLSNIIITDHYYSKKINKICYLKVIINNFISLLEPTTNLNLLQTEQFPIKQLFNNLIKISSLFKELHTFTVTRGQRYLDFSFESLSVEVKITAYNIQKSFNGNIIQFYFKEDFSFYQGEVDNKIVAIDPGSVGFTNKRVNSIIAYNQHILSEYENIPYDVISIDDLIEKYIHPKPKIDLNLDREFSVTDKILKFIIGDPNLINDDYKPGAQEFSEEFKKEILKDMQGQSENIDDPVLKEILKNSVSVSNLNELYSVILNRIDMDALVGLSVKCLMKAIPVSELKKIICRKIVQTIDNSQLKAISGFLEVAGDEISYQISKEIKNLDIGENPKALLNYMNSDLDREEKICLAVFAIIPAAILLLSKLLDNSDVFEDRVKRDVVLIKKAIQKRMEYLFSDNLTVFDIISSVRDGIIEAAKAFLVSTIMFVVIKTLAAVQEMCDSSEQDFLNTNILPYGRININDLLKQTKSNNPFYEKYPNLDDFLDDLSNNLTLTQVCLLINGFYKDEIIQSVLELLSKPQYSKISEVLNSETIIEFFQELGKNIDKILCEEALDKYEQNRKVLIEICANTDDLKKQIFDKLFDGSINPEDILSQIQRENEKNKGHLENLVDLLNPSQYIDNNCKDYHPSQEFLSKRYIQEMIKTISKSFEYELSGFKQVFERQNIDFYQKMLQKNQQFQSNSLTKEQSSIYVANGLRSRLKSNSIVSRFESKNDVQLYINHGFVQFTDKFTNLIYDKYKLNTEHQDFFHNFKLLVNKNNDLSYELDLIDENSFYGLTQEQILKTILSKSANNGLFLAQKFASYNIISGVKDSNGSCYAPMMSIFDFYALYTKFLKEIVCQIGPQADQYSLLKISYDLYVYILLFREIMKSFFLLSIFNWDYVFNDDSIIKKEMINNIKKQIESIDSDIFKDNFKSVLKLFYSKVEDQSFENLLTVQIQDLLLIAQDKLAQRYIAAGIDAFNDTLTTSDDVFFQQLVSDNKKNFVTQMTTSIITPDQKQVQPGLHLEFYYRPEYNDQFKNSLNIQEQNVYERIIEFIALTGIHDDLVDIGLSNIFVPGYKQIRETIKDYSKYLDVKNDLTIENYYNHDPLFIYKNIPKALTAYDSRGIISFDKAKELYIQEFTEQQLTYSSDQFLNLVTNYPPEDYPIDLKINTKQYIKKFLNKPITQLIKSLKIGCRFILIAETKNNFIDFSIKHLNNKIGRYDDKHYKICIESFETEKELSGTIYSNFFEGGFKKILNNYENIKDVYSGLEQKVKDDYLTTILDVKNLQSLAILEHQNSTEIVYPDIKSFLNTTLKTAYDNIITQTNVINGNWEATNKTMDNQNVGGNYQEFAIFEIVMKAFVKSMANTFDPTWQTPWFLPGPFTPIGVAAKLLNNNDDSNSNPVNDVLNGKKNDDSIC